MNLHVHVGGFVSAYFIVISKTGAQAEYLSYCGILVSRYETLKA